MKTHTEFQEVQVCDAEGKVGVLHVGEMIDEIGKGAHSRITEVLVEEKGPMAMKSFHSPGAAEAAGRGHEFLRLNLSPKEQKRLVQDFFVDPSGNRVFLPVLNKEKLVVSMGGNQSKDRADLEAHKIQEIPNFPEILQELLDSMEHASSRGWPLGPDVYFLTLDRKTHTMDYVYADTENVSSQMQGLSVEETTTRNLFWAGAHLNHFLHACVEHPQMYLERVRLEVESRMSKYRGFAGDGDLQDFQALQWPTLTWKQRLHSRASWFVTFVRRYISSLDR